MAGIVRAGPGAERVLQKLKKSIEDGNYYEAHQMYRTLYFRYMGQERYEPLLKLLYDGAMLLFQHQQHSSGADLAKLYVEVLQKAKLNVQKDIINNLADMMSKIPSSAPERQAFLMAALSWSQNENPESKKFEGHPQLHQMVANIYWRETNYHMARYHFIRSDDMDNLGSMLVEIQVDLGYPSEIDLFVTQAVLQILCIRNLSFANSLFDNYLERHPLLDNEPPFNYPLLNFTWMLLLAIRSTKLSAFAILCEYYQPSLKRDPSYKDYLDRIGQIYFGMPPPRGMSNQGMFGNLIQSLMGSLDGDSDSEDTTARSNLHASELD
ncbi:Golgi to ER traffic protein 4 homolog [Daphnia magna]|uniref:Golgi to ER traffic protein 4 n=1 Tax=Daphnia magna TaxID=35525 RepID=A0ABQ9ZA79_9CRUS|nr:Golgi to ER traffic protein 4 homolog [Daphnia magna]KAK4009808.1 hypothetical protein OUZ56_018954 [Daphnia magna]